MFCHNHFFHANAAVSRLAVLGKSWLNRLLACCHRKDKRQNQCDKSEKCELPNLFGVPDNARFFNLKVLFRVFLMIVVYYFIFLLFYFAFAKLGFEQFRPTNIFFIHLGYFPFFPSVIQGGQYRTSLRNKCDNQKPSGLKHPSTRKGPEYCYDNNTIYSNLKRFINNLNVRNIHE